MATEQTKDEVILISDLHGTLIQDKYWCGFAESIVNATDPDVTHFNDLAIKQEVIKKIEKAKNLKLILLSGGASIDLMIGLNVLNKQIGNSIYNADTKISATDVAFEPNGIVTQISMVLFGLGSGILYKRADFIPEMSISNDEIVEFSLIFKSFLTFCIQKMKLFSNFSIDDFVVNRDDEKFLITFLTSKVNFADPSIDIQQKSDLIRDEWITAYNMFSTLGTKEASIIKDMFFFSNTNEVESNFIVFRQNKGATVRRLKKYLNKNTKIITYGNGIVDEPMFEESDFAFYSVDSEFYQDNTFRNKVPIIHNKQVVVKSLQKGYIAGLLEILEFLEYKELI